MSNRPEWDASAPAPDNFAEPRQARDEFLTQLEALKDAIAEAEDFAAEFAIAMRLEAKQAQLEVERLSTELNDP